jgi:predicted CoA-substrate-specific enzyme activase
VTICAGIDAGSRTIKAALFDVGRQQLIGSATADQGVEQDSLARQLFDELIGGHGLVRGDIKRIVATGYGRNLIGFADTTITEITCHACGVRHLAPEARTVIEIGGQDSKLIRLSARGSVQDFAMNDRCAAGTGRFLEVVAGRLGLSLPELGQLAGQSRNPAAISSMCVVFAETEIIGLLASGAAPADIVAGVQQSIVTRIAAMAGRKCDAPIVFTGGVAMIPGMTQALAATLHQPVAVASEPWITGALGAAILAAQS